MERRKRHAVGMFISLGALASGVFLVWFFFHLRSTEQHAIDAVEGRFGIIISVLAWHSNLFGSLPDACYKKDGRDLYIWRFRIAPLVDTPFSYDFAQEWSAETNRAWHDLPNGLFCSSMVDPNDTSLTTCVMALVRGDSAMREQSSLPLDQVPPDTILVVETKNNDVHWMQCGDVHLDKTRQSATSLIGSSGRHRGFFVGFSDGQVWLLRDDTPRDLVSEFASVYPNERGKREDRFSKWRVHGRKPPSYVPVLPDVPKTIGH